MRYHADAGPGKPARRLTRPARGPTREPMKIATWNINGVKARLEGAVTWLKEASPTSSACRRSRASTRRSRPSAFEELGYNVAVHGQKGFNGVAILSKRPFDEIAVRGLPGDDSDDHARYIEVMRAAQRRRGARRQSLSAQRQSDRHRQVRLQARLDEALRGAHARAARPTRSRSCCRRLQRHPRADRRQEPRGLDRRRALPAARRAPPSARSSISGSPTPCAPACRGPASTPSGTIRPAPGRRTTASASTTSCSRRRPPTGWLPAGIDKHTRGWEKPSDHVPVWVEMDLD